MTQLAHQNGLRQIAASENIRFVLDLEFVELLAKPYYLQYLGYNRYFARPSFINYIDYLQYFHKPEYAVYVQHPHALYFLSQLQEPHFRAMLVESMFVHMLATQQRLHWRTFRSQRMLDAQQEQAQIMGKDAVEMPSMMFETVQEVVNPFLVLAEEVEPANNSAAHDTNPHATSLSNIDDQPHGAQDTDSLARTRQASGDAGHISTKRVKTDD